MRGVGAAAKVSCVQFNDEFSTIYIIFSAVLCSVGQRRWFSNVTLDQLGQIEDGII